MWKKAILVVVVLVLLVAAGVAWLVVKRPDAVEDWVARQVVGIVNGHLNPRLDYKTVDYRPPLEVAMKGVTLTAPDGTRVMDLGELGVVLAQTPRVGQPVVIERLVIRRGQINLIRQPAGKDGSGGGFKGLSPITKVAKPADAVPEAFRLSRVLKLRKVELEDCGVRFENPGSPPMVLAGITTTLDIVPDAPGGGGRGGGQAGWYTIDLRGGRAPAATLALKGRFNLDTYTLDVQQGRIETRLDPQTAGTLPPDVQRTLKDYDAAGTAVITLAGLIPLTSPATGNATADVSVKDFSFAAGGYRLPMPSLTGQVRLGGGAIDVPRLDAALLRGTLTASARVDMSSAARTLRVQWQALGLDLAQMHRDPKAAQEPKKIVGILATRGTASTELGDAMAKLTGSGEAQLRQGRLFALPGFLEVLGKLDAGLLGKVGLVNNHEGDAEFTFRPGGGGSGGVELTRSEVRTELMAARATGLVTFDRRLDLKVNAGPLERLQSALGKIGQIIGKVTDQLATYRVTGTFDDPKVSLELGK